MDNLQKLEIPAIGVTQEFASIVFDLVHNLIEQCIASYMTKDQAVVKLERDHAIPPAITLELWKSLEEENSDFFRAYNVRLVVMQHIIRFNQLLEQMDQMRVTHAEQMEVQAQQYEAPNKDDSPGNDSGVTNGNAGPGSQPNGSTLPSS